MTTKFFLFYLLITIIIISCGKNNETTNQSTVIDVSKQWQVNPVGQLVLGLTDGQWQNKVFTTQEQNLFISLDTANLLGTTKPDSVFETNPVSNNFTIPNPFTSFNQLRFGFTNGYTGQLVLKFVIVDSLMNSLYKGVIKIQASICSTCPLNPSSSNLITITPNIPIGRFRFYYSLSSQLNQHFYKSWGNIQKTQ